MQLVFCGIMLFAFHQVSLMRPVAYPCLYKEYLCAGIVPMSRNCFVMCHAVADFSKKDVDLRGDGGWNMQLPITDAYRESAIPLLQGKTQQEEWGQPRNEKTYKAIYDYIACHPRCSAQDIRKHTGLAPSSVYRYVRLLKEDGLIDREGSNKAGGYCATLKDEN